MYEAPTVIVMGRLEDMTLGQFFSRADGNSGTVGNRGQGQGGIN